MDERTSKNGFGQEPDYPASDKPIAPGIIQRVAQGIRYMMTGRAPMPQPATIMAPPAAQTPQNRDLSNQGYFGPSLPPRPLAPDDVKGREYDYPVGVNLAQQPRYQELTTFQQLRNLADGYDLLRLVIETRKDQIAKLKWSIKPKKKPNEPIRAKADDRCDAIQDFLAYPDKEHDWDTWLRELLEDMLVVDAATVYPRRNMVGGLYGFDLIDGTTIKRIIDNSGRTPLPPSPAYQQILHGVAANDYTADELIYYPRNVRTHKLYGYSPVEQIVMTVNIALRRQIFQLAYFTEGNVPEALATVPENWTPDQIVAYQNYWDNLLAGDLNKRRRMRFIPGGTGFLPTRNDGGLKDEFDEWLARVVCYAFSLPALPFIRMMNRATAQTAQEAALQEGLGPIMEWIKNLIDKLILKYFGYTDIEFAWEDYEVIPAAQRAQINEAKLHNGVISLDDWRAQEGLPPTGLGPALWGIGPLGITLVEDLADPVKRAALMESLTRGGAPGQPQSDPIGSVPEEALTGAGLKPGDVGVSPSRGRALQIRGASIHPGAADALKIGQGATQGGIAGGHIAALARFGRHDLVQKVAPVDLDDEDYP